MRQTTLLSINFDEKKANNVKINGPWESFIVTFLVLKIRKLTPLKRLLKQINRFIEIVTALQVNLLEAKNFSYMA